jgi:hypothetical protein
MSSFLTFLGGGGLVGAITKLWQTYMQADQQDHEIGQQIRDELKDLLDQERGERKALEERVETLEARVEEEREQRMDAERHAMIAQQKLDLVIRLLNDMRQAAGKRRLNTEDLTLLAIDASPTTDK